MSEPTRRWRGGPAPRTARATAAGLAALVVAAGCGGGEDSTGPTESVKEVDLSLSTGESQTITPDSMILQVNVPAPDDDGAEYRLAVQSASKSVGSTPMRLEISTDGGSSKTVPARRTGWQGRRLRAIEVDPLGHRHRRRLQQRALEMLQRRGIRPSDGRRDVRTQSKLPSNEEPQEGDILKFWFPVDSTGSVVCDTTEADTLVAEVQAVNSGGEVAMVEDTTVDDGPTADMDYQALADEFDNTVFGTDVDYFGSQSDIDGNQRVLVLFSNKVNELSASLTDDDGGAVVAGFFIPADLADSGDPNKDGSDADTCAAGNEAEVLWLLAPDPDGSTGETVEVPRATTLARSTSSHEFEHLLNLANRLFKAGGTFADAEETWLDEGLAHLAEEIIGLDKSDEALRQNLTFSDVTGTASEDSTFRAFLLGDFGNLARYLQLPAETRALAFQDPDETEASLRMRGFAWMFLRWLADREHIGQAGAEPGSGDPEEAFFGDLAKADGQNLDAGVANVEGVTGREWSRLLADFGLAMAVDDDEPQAPARQQVLTWDLRDIYRELHAASGDFPFNLEYPLAPTQNSFASLTSDFEVQAGTGKYFALSSDGSAPGVTLELTNQAGGPLTSGSPQITIIRTR